MITYDIYPTHEKMDYLINNQYRHYDDVKDKSLYPEININWDLYKELSEVDLCKVVIVSKNGEKIGYSAYTLTVDLNNMKSIVAYNVALFIEKKHRGRLVIDFIKECDRLLVDEGISSILYNYSDVRIGRILEKAGYAPKSVNWIKTFV
jgi:hypothetical protein